MSPPRLMKGRRTDQQRKSYEVTVPPESYRLTDLAAHRKRFASSHRDLYCRTPAWPQSDYESGVGGDSQARTVTLIGDPACLQDVVKGIGKGLIESGSPERETRKRRTGKHSKNSPA
ncbi:hypothetical protein GCM10010518_59830 [Kitasatospora cinereorecta]